MAENDEAPDGTVTDQSSTEAAGDGGTGGPDELTILRKRQAGADKAREAAIAERDALQARLDAALAAKSGKSGDDDKSGTVDVEALKRELQADFDKKLAETVAAERGKALDAQFPEARKRFPEVTDPAKLVELETLFGEPQKPVGNNPPKRSEQKNIEDMTSKELQAYMKGLDPSAVGISRN